MRKLGIIFAIAATATLGIAGTASAQEQAPLCDGVHQVTEGLAEGGAPIPETSDGVHQSCMESSMDDGFVLNHALCGVEKDLTELDEQLGAIPAGVHGGLDDQEEPDGIIGQIEAGAGQEFVNFDHPCDDGGGGGGGECTENCGNKKSNNGGDTDPEVLANNAAADGGLPRTGAPELLAGLGFGLTGIGALVRRFIG